LSSGGVANRQARSDFGQHLLPFEGVLRIDVFTVAGKPETTTNVRNGGYF
jgi:hypothetical protein